MGGSSTRALLLICYKADLEATDINLDLQDCACILQAFVPPITHLHERDPTYSNSSAVYL